MYFVGRVFSVRHTFILVQVGYAGRVGGSSVLMALEEGGLVGDVRKGEKVQVRFCEKNVSQMIDGQRREEEDLL